MIIVKQLLDRKREGHALGSAEIRELVNGLSNGSIPDYQISAFLMAVCCRGMTVHETEALTDAMMRSGAMLEWSDLSVPTADKHSTGGVGDKLSLVIQPLAASCGVAVPSLTGRGLGHTGGTADKLEAIPGYDASLSLEEFRKVVAKTGVSMTLQTAEICPADKKMYALRDVTGTVASIPLITGSILSKKLAEGAGTLVFDVKCGSGAFMQTSKDATELAMSLTIMARDAGRQAAALITDMNAPLGFAVGNANEVAEALEILANQPERLADVTDLCVEFASLMISLARKLPFEEAQSLCRQALADGSALARFEAMVEAQGGDLKAFRERFANRATAKFRVQSIKSGYICAIDPMRVASVALELGAGRKQAGEAIDSWAGVTLDVKIGDKIAVGAPLAMLETICKPGCLEHEAAELLKAFEISPEPPAPRQLILGRMAE